MTFEHVARLQMLWQAQHFVNLEVQISWQAALCEPGSADFVAGTALCEPGSAWFGKTWTTPTGRTL